MYTNLKSCKALTWRIHMTVWRAMRCIMHVADAYHSFIWLKHITLYSYLWYPCIRNPFTHVADAYHSFVWHMHIAHWYDSFIWHMTSWRAMRCIMHDADAYHSFIWLMHTLQYSYLWYSRIRNPSMCVSVSVSVSATCRAYRVAKTHRIPYLHRSFFAKMTYIQWLFCGHTVFATLYHHNLIHILIFILWGGYDFLKLQVSVAKEPYKRDCIPQKRL